MKLSPLQFGELENVYCPTGKGYAFMTFKYASGIDAVQRARYVTAFHMLSSPRAESARAVTGT